MERIPVEAIEGLEEVVKRWIKDADPFRQIARVTTPGIADAHIRAIAREEIASFAGLLLGAIGQHVAAEELESVEERIEATDATVHGIAAGLSEALRDFGGAKDGPGADSS